MAKGKYAKRAEITRDVNQVTEALGKSEQVAENLQKENDRLRAEMDRRAGLHASQVADLLDDNEQLTNGAVRAVEVKLAEMTALHDALAIKQDKLERKHERVFEATCDVVRRIGGISYEDALGEIMSELQGRKVSIDLDSRGLHTSNADVVKVLQAKGKYPKR